jgi:inorganic triphosphatase YgiF
MTQKAEIELKLEPKNTDIRTIVGALESNTLLRQSAPQAESKELVSVYFDTSKLKLRKHGVSLRVRHFGDHHVQTIKQDGPGAGVALTRDEWECEVEDQTPDLGAARGTALERLLSRKVRSSLRPLFETRVQRTVYPVKLDGSDIELSFDKGHVEDGRQSSDFCEVELELIHGDGAQLFRLAHQLANRIPLEICVRSKAERGYALITGESPESVKSPPTNISSGLETQAAFKAIARGCLHHLIANVPALRAGDPEGLHQGRVALRRLRSAISLFSALLNDKQTEEIKREFKWVTGEFGPARELDVFLTRVVGPLAARHRDDESIRRLDLDITRRREEAFDRARAAIDSARFRKLLLDVAAWIEVGEWTRTEDELLRALRKQQVNQTAFDQLERRWKKILKRGRRLESLDSFRLHKLRIAAKKLRYASDFFEGAFAGKKVARRRKRFIRGLKSLQDALGDLNDIRVHIEVTRDLGHGSKATVGSRAFVAGRISGREEARRAAVLKSAQDAFDGFRREEPYWN